MDDDPVIVPPEVRDELEPLREDGELDPTDRQRAADAAADRGYDAAAKWLERVGDDVYERAARGRVVAGDET